MVRNSTQDIVGLNKAAVNFVLINVKMNGGQEKRKVKELKKYVRCVEKNSVFFNLFSIKGMENSVLGRVFMNGIEAKILLNGKVGGLNKDVKYAVKNFIVDVPKLKQEVVDFVQHDAPINNVEAKKIPIGKVA